MEGVLMVRQWTDSDEVLLVFNFASERRSLELPVPLGEWRKRLDSADARWARPGLAGDRELLSPGRIQLELPADVVRALSETLNRLTTYGTLSLHSRAFLPAAARESVARSDRAAGLRLPVPRLERARSPRSVTRRTPRRADARRRRPHRGHREQLRAHQLQLRPDAAGLDGGARARTFYAAIVEADRQSRAALLRARLGDGPSLQSHDPAAGQPARQAHAGAAGASATSSIASAASPKGCGCRKPRRTPRRWRCSPSTASASPSSRRTRPSSVRPLRGGHWKDVNGGQRRSLARLPCQTAVRPRDRRVLLRRADLAGGGLRAVAEQRRAFAGRLMDGVRRRARTGINSCTSPPTANPTATTIATARWRWPTRCTTSKPTTWRKLTNYGEFLERHPPAHEAQIHEQSAWSCSHGVGRWFADCGCNSGGRPGWHQDWRAPLREALDWLRDTLAPRFE